MPKDWEAEQSSGRWPTQARLWLECDSSSGEESLQVEFLLFLLKVVAEVIDPVMSSFQLTGVKRSRRTIETTNIRMLNLFLIVYPSID